MKITVTISLEIDEEAWTLNYGVEGKAAIRQDAKAHADNLVREHFRDLGLTKEES